MTAPTWLPLAERLAAHPRGGFRAGMGILREVDTGAVDRGIMLCLEQGQMLTNGYWYPSHMWRIDMESWPTVGVLLGMLAETSDYVSLCRAPDRQWWAAAGDCEHPEVHPGDCAGVALAEALLRAWGEP